MEPSSLGPDNFRHRGGEGDYVVTYFRFDFEDSRDLKVGALANSLGRRFRHHAGPSQSFRGRDFDLQPAAEAIFIAPNAAHLRASVARDQSGNPPGCYPQNLGQRILNGSMGKRPVRLKRLSVVARLVWIQRPCTGIMRPVRPYISRYDILHLALSSDVTVKASSRMKKLTLSH